MIAVPNAERVPRTSLLRPNFGWRAGYLKEDAVCRKKGEFIEGILGSEDGFRDPNEQQRVRDPTPAQDTTYINY